MKTDEIITRIRCLEEQVISLKYPKGFEIGAKVQAYGFGNPDGLECFIASKVYMQSTGPWINVFVPELNPPMRDIPVTSLFKTQE